MASKVASAESAALIIPESVSEPAAQSHRIALILEYDGSDFAGWQKQSSPKLNTVQGSLEQALSKIADTPISTVCAGRTDAGVHATSQVVHFDTPIDRGEKAWTTGVNSLLPASIRVLQAIDVSPDFHARFSATARRYQYILYRRSIAPALITGKVSPWYRDLDIAAMHEAAQYLPGEQDFSVFRAAGCQSKSPYRDVQHARVSARGPFVVFDIQANAFLQHMVRNIMGSLLVIGLREQAPQWIAELLASRDRTQAAMTAAPDGLYLVQVFYAGEFGLAIDCQVPPLLQACD